jgi:hypothetical protein
MPPRQQREEEDLAPCPTMFPRSPALNRLFIALS